MKKRGKCFPSKHTVLCLCSGSRCGKPQKNARPFHIDNRKINGPTNENIDIFFILIHHSKVILGLIFALRIAKAHAIQASNRRKIYSTQNINLCVKQFYSVA